MHVQISYSISYMCKFPSRRLLAQGLSVELPRGCRDAGLFVLAPRCAVFQYALGGLDAFLLPGRRRSRRRAGSSEATVPVRRAAGRRRSGPRAAAAASGGGQARSAARAAPCDRAASHGGGALPGGGAANPGGAHRRLRQRAHALAAAVRADRTDAPSRH